jgi:DNA-binding transcriptional regulator LsrR (DeoR family)
MVTVLKRAIAQLDATSQQLLKFYYHERLTQQLIAQKLELQQYAVSRYLTKTRASLLKTIVAWSQTTLHISPTSDVIDAISIQLEEWLESCYHPAECN